MRAIVKPKMPKDMSIKIEMDLSLSEWQELNQQILDNKWPSCRFKELLQDALRKVCMDWPDNVFEVAP